MSTTFHPSGLSIVRYLRFRDVGLVVGFLILHRVTVAYQIFWEARDAIGSIVVHCKCLVRKTCTTLTSDHSPQVLRAVRHSVARRTVLFYTLLRLKLEKADAQTTGACIALLQPHEPNNLTESKVTPQCVLQWIQQDLHLLLTLGHPVKAILSIEEQVVALIKYDACCMKLLTTSVPASYQQLQAAATLVFIILMPTPMITSWDWLIGFPTTAACGLLLGVLSLTKRLEIPFSTNRPFFCMATMGMALQDDVREAMCGIDTSIEARVELLLKAHDTMDRSTAGQPTEPSKVPVATNDTNADKILSEIGWLP